jgi:selenocysteine lyase/cysteine desulfurase
MTALPALPPGFDVERESPSSTRWTFFNHAAVAPLAARAANAVRTYAEQAERDAYLTGGWHPRIEQIRGSAARLINARPDEIAFAKNTSEGIAWVANGLPWKAGDEIFSTAAEYPTMVYPWMDLAARCGVRHIMVPERDGRIASDELLGQTSGIVAFASAGHDHAKLVHTLQEQRIVLALRDGRLRASPPFYQSPDHVDRLLAALPADR